MTPTEALELALEREIESIKLYAKFISEYPAAKETFFFLMQEEEKHKKLIEEKIVELRCC